MQYKGGQTPQIVFASGSSAPHLPRQKKLISTLPDEEFIKEISSLNGGSKQVYENKELMNLLLPVLRADFTMVETYMAEAIKLCCPIYALHGEYNPEVAKGQAEAWRELTNLDFKIETFNGGHFFINDDNARVLEFVNQSLNSLVC